MPDLEALTRKFPGIRSLEEKDGKITVHLQWYTRTWTQSEEDWLRKELTEAITASGQQVIFSLDPVPEDNTVLQERLALAALYEAEGKLKSALGEYRDIAKVFGNEMARQCVQRLTQARA